MPHKIDPLVTYQVWYKPNPEYDGTFQLDKMGKGGKHATVTPEMGGYNGAIQAAARCKAWFNEERTAVETSTDNGKVIVNVKTAVHNNVIVWIEKYVDGTYVEEEFKPCLPESNPVAVEQDQSQMLKAMQAQIDKLTRMIAEREKAEVAEESQEDREPAEELAGVR